MVFPWLMNLQLIYGHQRRFVRQQCIAEKYSYLIFDQNIAFNSQITQTLRNGIILILYYPASLHWLNQE